MINDLLGGSFRLVRHFDHSHRQPGGDPRPFVYTLLRYRDGG